MIIPVLLATILKITIAARILGVAPLPSYSHQIVFRAIWKELAARGHQLVVLTTDPINDPSIKNYEEIDLSFTYQIIEKIKIQEILRRSNIFKTISSFGTIITNITVEELAHPNVQNLINNKTEHFDLVMMEYSMPTFLAFKHRFNAPFIGLYSMDASALAHNDIGNPTHPVIYPDFQLAFDGNLNFFNRVISTYFEYVMKWYTDYIFDTNEDAIIEKYFGKGYPKLADMRKDISMLFINTNPILHTSRPLIPATITIGGGIHIEKEKQLPKALKQFLDDAHNGVIYISLGTNIKSTQLRLETKNIMLNVFSELPYKVLWKYENEEMLKTPDNVKLMKWIPQQDVLRHPNVKVFVSQGGLQSVEEAFYNNVPIIGIPFMGDQFSNCQKIESQGLGLQIDYRTITSSELKMKILKVIKNPMYRNNVKRIAELARDQPMTGLEKAIWWTEYILRHNGTQHLKGPGIHIPFYQYYHLDVLAFTLFVLAIIIRVVHIIIKKMIIYLNKLLIEKKVKQK